MRTHVSTNSLIVAYAPLNFPNVRRISMIALKRRSKNTQTSEKNSKSIKEIPKMSSFPSNVNVTSWTHPYSIKIEYPDIITSRNRVMLRINRCVQISVSLTFRNQWIPFARIARLKWTTDLIRYYTPYPTDIHKNLSHWIPRLLYIILLILLVITFLLVIIPKDYFTTILTLCQASNLQA